MKHIRLFNESISIDISNFIEDIKDMSLDLSDEGYVFDLQVDPVRDTCVNAYLRKRKVNIDDKGIGFTGNSKYTTFTMTKDVSKFFLRLRSYVDSNPNIEMSISSNHGNIYVYPDSRGIRSSGHKLGPNYPSLTMMNIIFKFKYQK
jgi:hypothetical protein